MSKTLNILAAEDNVNSHVHWLDERIAAEEEID